LIKQYNNKFIHYYYMKVLSIDVGIKNLAFCLFEKKSDSDNFCITKWDTINISEQETLSCGIIDCDKPAKFKKDNSCYCLKHSKKQPLQIPSAEQKPAFINKQKIQKLYEIADAHKITYHHKCKKADLAILINNYIKDHYFESIEAVRAADVDLFNIGLNIKTHFNKIFENEIKIDYVIIENQISPIATRMKTIQGMIVQYFVMTGLQVDHIEFISAANKLKDCAPSEKSKYSDRKKLGIAKCLETITNDYRFSEHVDYFNKHKKKDDLADSFLQGIYFIHLLKKVEPKP
jgi:hypothetical protein